MGHERIGGNTGSSQERPVPAQEALRNFLSHPTEGVRDIRLITGMSEAAVIGADASRKLLAQKGKLSDAGRIASFDQHLAELSRIRANAHSNPVISAALRRERSQFLRDVWGPYVQEASSRLPGAGFDIESHRRAIAITAAESLITDIYNLDNT